MRTRTISAVLGTSLISAGLSGLLLSAGGPAQAAIPTARLYFHSAAGGYRGDAQADPTGNDDRNPKGSTTDEKPPTKTADSLATYTYTPASFAGAPNIPTFSFAVSGTVTNICLDAWFQGRTTGDSAVVKPLINTPDAFVRFSDVVIKPYAGALTRVTAMATYDKPTVIPPDSEYIFTANYQINPDLTMVYDSVSHPSNVTVNPTSCTPVPVAGPASASAAPSATAAPSASASAAPSASASAAPSASATATKPPSAAPSGSATAVPSGSATASVAPSASSSPSAAPSPNCPTTSGSAQPSASTAPSTSASAAPSTSGTAAASATASAPAASGSAAPSASASPGGGGISSPQSCRASTVTLAADVLQVTAGNTPTLSGVVRDERGDAIEGATITIFTKGYGETRYTAAATVVTNGAGQYSISVRPLKQTAYGANVGNAKSPVLNIRVSTRVNITRPVPGAVNNPVTFTGTLNPGYASVAVGLGYLVNGRFVVLKQANTNGTGGYTITATLPRGTFAFVIFTSAHQGTDKGSKSVRLTVR